MRESFVEEFNLEGHDYVELCDLLKLTGLTHSGGSAKQAISEGDVLVDGAIETRKRCKVRSGQVVKFDGREIRVV